MTKVLQLVFILICVVPAIAFGQWIDREGNVLPDSPEQKSIGELGAWLILSKDEQELFHAWNTPSESVYVDSADSIARGEMLTAVVVFFGCEPMN